MSCLSAPLALGLLLGLSAAHAASPPDAPRFQLQGQLQPQLPTRSDDRFSLRAQLVPAASRPDPSERFVLAAKLEPQHKAICVPDAEIFRDGFEPL